MSLRRFVTNSSRFTVLTSLILNSQRTFWPLQLSSARKRSERLSGEERRGKHLDSSNAQALAPPPQPPSNGAAASFHALFRGVN